MAGDASLRTPLYAWHLAQGARLVEFGGWLMPVQYSTIAAEHQAVRQHVGLFDISHMGRLAFEGPDVLAWLNRVTTNDAARLEPGQIQYSLIVAEDGGVLDDILVYRLADGAGAFGGDRTRYAVVCNASNRIRVIAQLEQHRGSLDATLRDLTFETTMIAVQGPDSLAVMSKASDASLAQLRYYHSFNSSAFGTVVTISRTGYTGEDGFELVAPREFAERAWATLLDAGRDFAIQPCGLGARDTLRLEAAMPLYCHELSENVNPYAAGLGWAVKLNKGDFVGRAALRVLKNRPGQTRVGLVLEGKRIARQGYDVKRNGQTIGAVTSGTFSPTLEKSLAMALVNPSAAIPGTRLEVDVRGHAEPAVVAALPFYKKA